MDQTAPRPAPWYYAAAIVIMSGCLLAMVNFGVRSTFGLFTKPISEAHQWPREIFSLAMALQNLIWGLATPVAGALADRFGAARVMIGGALFYAAGVFTMAIAPTPMLFHVGGGLLTGVGIAMSSFGIVMAALGRLVGPERRSWAFGIATAASSMGQFIFAPVAGALIAAYDWATALKVMAALSLLMLPLALPFLNPRANAVHATADEADMTLRQALACAFSHGSYILLVFGFFVCGFQIAFVTVHLPPYLAGHGITPEFAGFAIAFIGLFNIIGSYAAGVIGGRGNKRIPLSLIYLIRSVVVTLFITTPITNTTTLLFTSALGLLWLSTVPFTIGLVAVMFGTRYLATLYGFVFLSHQIGSFLGVWLGGRIFDATGSYDPVWWMGVVLGVFAFLVHLPIREHAAPAFAKG